MLNGLLCFVAWLFGLYLIDGWVDAVNLALVPKDVAGARVVATSFVSLTCFAVEDAISNWRPEHGLFGVSFGAASLALDVSFAILGGSVVVLCCWRCSVLTVRSLPLYNICVTY